MSILIAIAAIGIILLTLPLLGGLLRSIGELLGNVLGIVIGIGVIIGIIYLLFFKLDFNDYKDFGIVLLEIFFYIALPLFLLNFLIRYIKGRNEKKLRLAREKQELTEEEETKKINDKINEFIINGDTSSTFKDKNNITYGGKLNTEGWNFFDVLRFISKNSLKVKDLDLKSINPILDEELETNNEKLTKKIFADEIEEIAHEKQFTTINNECLQSIKNINEYREYCAKLKKWIIINLKNILLEEAKKGHKLPLTLYPTKYDKDLKLPTFYFVDWRTNEAPIIISDDFSFLEIEIEGEENFTTRHGFEMEEVQENPLKMFVFELISSNIKFGKHLTNLGLKYSLSYDSEIIFKIDKL